MAQISVLLRVRKFQRTPTWTCEHVAATIAAWRRGRKRSRICVWPKLIRDVVPELVFKIVFNKRRRGRRRGSQPLIKLKKINGIPVDIQIPKLNVIFPGPKGRGPIEATAWPLSLPKRIIRTAHLRPSLQGRHHGLPYCSPRPGLLLSLPWRWSLGSSGSGHCVRHIVATRTAGGMPQACASSTQRCAARLRSAGSASAIAAR